MAKISVPQVTIIGVRKRARKMSRATSKVWVILKQDEFFHIMAEEQYEVMLDKDEFEFVEYVARVVKE